MTLESITIPWAPVKALLNLAGKADIRPYVNGVWIDRAGPELVIWATTGTVLGAWRTDEPSTNGPPVFLPREAVENGKFTGLVVIAGEPGGRMKLGGIGDPQEWNDPGHTPPAWRNAVPRDRADGTPRQFDLEKALQFEKVRKALKLGAVRIAHTSEPKRGESRPDALHVSFKDCPDFVGVLAPIGGAPVDGMRTCAPDWVHAPATVGADLC